jgi:ribonuclease PH
LAKNKNRYSRKGRADHEMRKVSFDKDVMENAYSSVMIQCGNTKVLCTASVNDDLPPFVDEKKQGWITAEYNMLPGSTLTRKSRSIYKPDSRGIEIQRIIARALRAAIDLSKIKGWSIIIDCDVIQADGGTRTASITGGYVALELAIKRMLKEKKITKTPLITKIASVSACIMNSDVLIDPDYFEDKNADADINLVMNEKGNFVEIQGTGENGDVSKDIFMKVLDLSQKAIKELFELQKAVLKK